MTQVRNSLRQNGSPKKETLTVLKCMICHPLSRKHWVYGFGVFFLILAIAAGIFWPSVAKSLLRHQLRLEDGTLGYQNWFDIPVPVYMTVTMFNWTNPQDILKRNYKPYLVEMGPYVFLEKHTRVNVAFHRHNDTVTFDQIRTWHFVPEKSNGTMNDKVTSVNVVAASVAHHLQKSIKTLAGKTKEDIFGAVNNFIQEDVLSLSFLRKNTQNLFQKNNLFLDVVGSMRALKHPSVTKTIQELLFDGYSDEFLTMVKKLKLPNVPPFEKFAWFVGRNGSSRYDGHFEMQTGLNDIKQMGKLTKWNYVNQTNFYPDKCGQVQGSTGELWPMEMNATADISVFVTDLCRPLTLKYQKNYTHYGVTGSRWVGDDRVFDNGEKYPPNKCYCNGHLCPNLPSGVYNMSACHFGVPIFASFPHFYLADKSYVDAIDGMNPNQKEHEFSLTLEPFTGATLQADTKIQINTLIQRVPGLGIFGNIPKLMIPVFWTRQSFEIDKQLTNEVKIATQLPSYGPYVSIGIASIAAILLISGAILTFTKSWKADKMSKVKPTRESQPMI